MEKAVSKKKRKLTIDSSSKHIVQDCPIELSDIHLKETLRNLYERARTDACKIRFYNYYNVLWSVSATLFLTLLTSDFKSFMGFDSQLITKIAWIVTVILFVLGLIFIVYKNISNTQEEYKERDKATEEAIDQLLHDSIIN